MMNSNEEVGIKYLKCSKFIFNSWLKSQLYLAGAPPRAMYEEEECDEIWIL
jgi:hypothetical protein